eukprot:TRINITY_DN8177_c0_g1_i8.p1 TRINITY_DN8177_c0_g1~~TRINITY_DN8177_c0_g1_i8.p1  ORF type:complete len:1018 (-),score=122.25 TRINITY_DN8177_c0_g1_i8:39-3062(-)
MNRREYCMLPFLILLCFISFCTIVSSATPPAVYSTVLTNSGQATVDLNINAFALASQGNMFVVGYRSYLDGHTVGLLYHTTSIGFPLKVIGLGAQATDYNQINAVIVGNDDKLYIAGRYNTSRTLVVGSTSSLPPSTSMDVFVCRYNGYQQNFTDNPDWCIYGHGDGDDYITGMDLDQNGNIVVVGYHNSADVQWGSAEHGDAVTPPSLRGYNRGLLVRISPLGQVLYNQYQLGPVSLRSGNDFRIKGITIQTLDLYIITGSVKGSVSMASHSSNVTDLFIARTTSSAFVEWILTSSVPEGANSETYIHPLAIASDNETVVIVGKSNSADRIAIPHVPGTYPTVTFTPTSSTRTFGWLYALHPRNGSFLYSHHFTGTSMTYADLEMTSVAIDRCGGVYVGGTYTSLAPPFSGLEASSSKFVKRIAAMKFDGGVVGGGAYLWGLSDLTSSPNVTILRDVTMRHVAVDRTTGITTWIGELDEGPLILPSRPALVPSNSGRAFYHMKVRSDVLCPVECETLVDDCGVCGGSGLSCRDCQGTINGTKMLDACGECGGNSTCLDCMSIPFGNATRDGCGVCGGNNSTCPKDCRGTVYGTVTIDACGVCGGRNNTCPFDCARVPHGNATYDSCGVCGGHNDTCPFDCAGVAYGNSMRDACGVCGGRNNTCPFDCARVAYGNATYDSCGVCGGTNATCGEPTRDCAGIINGIRKFDVCGVCSLPASPAACLDCSGRPYGNATIDRCGICEGDNSTCYVAPSNSSSLVDLLPDIVIDLPISAFLRNITVRSSSTTVLVMFIPPSLNAMLNNLLYSITPPSPSALSVSSSSWYNTSSPSSSLSWKNNIFSSIVNITIRSSSSSSSSSIHILPEPSQMIFKVDINTTSLNNTCLGYINETTLRWECEDDHLVWYDGDARSGRVMAQTTHLTSFAIIINPNIKNKNENNIDGGLQELGEGQPIDNPSLDAYAVGFGSAGAIVGGLLIGAAIFYMRRRSIIQARLKAKETEMRTSTNNM